MSYTDYDQFADIYNRRWGGYAHNVVDSLDALGLADLEPGDQVVDLCCGTGQLAAVLLARGLRVTGVDGSREMIEFAQANAVGARFVVADARAIEVDSPAAMVVSTFDSLNHVMTLAGLGQVFRHVIAALQPGGRFIFDLNTEAGYLARWNGSLVVDDEDEFLVADSSYDPAERTGAAKFTWFVAQDDGWKRNEITLTQRCYSVAAVTGALEEAGFEAIGDHDASQLVDGWQAGRSFFVADRSR